MELGRSSERLARPGGAALAGTVDEQDGGLESALRVAQEAEYGSDLGDGVFVDAVQADQGVEDHEVWRDALHGLAQTLPVVRIRQLRLVDHADFLRLWQLSGH